MEVDEKTKIARAENELTSKGKKSLFSYDRVVPEISIQGIDYKPYYQGLKLEDEGDEEAWSEKLGQLAPLIKHLLKRAYS
jgi:hypothetical protein